MKPVGFILLVVGVLALLIGLLVIFNTVTSTYASDACAKAAKDQNAYNDAKQLCRDTFSTCYKEATRSLTPQQDCDDKKSFMTKQLTMGIVPTVIGFLLIIPGGFFAFRRKKAVP